MCTKGELGSHKSKYRVGEVEEKDKSVVIAAAQDIYEDMNDNAKLGILIY